MRAEATRPAFYALKSGGWRDYVTLLHVPYTAWHLSYVAIGAALSSAFSWARLWPTLLAFGLAVGIGAHALDELNGRPLRTRIPARVLVALAGVSIAGATAVGIVGAVTVNPWIGAFAVAGAFIVVAYNLEWFEGRFHGDFWFPLAWGAFPLLSAYFATAETLGLAALAGAVFAFATSVAQRRLSEGRKLSDGALEALERLRRLAEADAALLLRLATTPPTKPAEDHPPAPAEAVGPLVDAHLRRARLRELGRVYGVSTP